MGIESTLRSKGWRSQASNLLRQIVEDAGGKMRKEDAWNLMASRYNMDPRHLVNQESHKESRLASKARAWIVKAAKLRATRDEWYLTKEYAANISRKKGLSYFARARVLVQFGDECQEFSNAEIIIIEHK